METENQETAIETEKASNLRAIFEILSYIHVDAAKDDFKELADRIEFALNLAEKLVRNSRNAAKPEGEATASAVAAADSGAEGANAGFY